MLAEKLKEAGAGDLYLVVSHGIFSKGFKELKKHYKKIYTSDSWSNDYGWETPEKEKGSEIVEIIKFNYDDITRI
jgi:phosphoribosylpyrophosphate synthetase